MSRKVRATLVLGALAIGSFTVLACTVGTTSTGGSGGSSEPQEKAQITSPTSGLNVSATIASVTLGEECGGAGAQAAPQAGDCAEESPNCGGTAYCQQSNVQISFNAATGSQSARVEVVSITLHDSATGDLVDTLTASKPQAWTGTGYAAWDQTVKPGGELKASYDLSAPKWSTISSGRTTSAYSTKYKLNVRLRIDGIEFVLQSTDLNREPQVAT